MSEKQPTGDITKMLLEFGDAVEHEKAKEILQGCKNKEAESKSITVYVNNHTTKIISLEKIRRKKIEIIKVKLHDGRLVFMEKDNAIKKGYINE